MIETLPIRKGMCDIMLWIREKVFFKSLGFEKMEKEKTSLKKLFPDLMEEIRALPQAKD